MELTLDMAIKLAMQGFPMTKTIPNQGIVAMKPMVFTIGLFCHLTELDYQYRYCYDNFQDALHDFDNWNGEGHPPGPWLKCKGKYVDLMGKEPAHKEALMLKRFYESIT